MVESEFTDIVFSGDPMHIGKSALVLRIKYTTKTRNYLFNLLNTLPCLSISHFILDLASPLQQFVIHM